MTIYINVMLEMNHVNHASRYKFNVTFFCSSAITLFLTYAGVGVIWKYPFFLCIFNL